MSATVHADKRIFREIALRVEGFNHIRVQVGIFVGELAYIGLIHEFGWAPGNIPERSWLRSTLVDRRREIAAMKARMAAGVISGVLTPERAMSILGEFVVQLVKEQIIKHGPTIWEPLKPETIRRKSRGGKLKEKPLIDTAQMLNAITYRIIHV